MKWFIVFMVVQTNGHVDMVINDRTPFDTPTQCQAQQRLRQAAMDRVENGVAAKVFCAGNQTVGDFMYNAENGR